MKHTPNNEQDLSTGRSRKWEYDLATDSIGLLSINTQGFGFGCVTVQFINCTGTSGNLQIKQGNDDNNIFPFPTPLTIVTGTNVNAGVFNIDISGQYLVIDRSAMTWGVTGKVIITMAIKRSGSSGQTYIASSPTSSTPASLSLIESTGVLEIHDNITTGGVCAENTCIYVKIENIGSQPSFITASTGAITLQPGESFYEEMQLLDKVYRQARVEFNPNGSTLRVTKKLRT